MFISKGGYRNPEYADIAREYFAESEDASFGTDIVVEKEILFDREDFRILDYIVAVVHQVQEKKGYSKVGYITEESIRMRCAIADYFLENLT